MNSEPKLLHAAVQTTDRKEAETFFTTILQIPKTRSFTLLTNLAQALFEDPAEKQVDVYQNAHTLIEVFEEEKTSIPRYAHLCLEVANRKKLIERCKTYKIPVFEATINDKHYVFIKDFTGNRYEIKEAPSA